MVGQRLTSCTPLALVTTRRWRPGEGYSAAGLPMRPMNSIDWEWTSWITIR